MRDYIYYAGKNLNEYQLFITDAGAHDAPARNYDSIPIAGRSGNLIFENNKFDNLDLRYPAAIIADFEENFNALKGFLLSQTGYCRLSDTFNTDIFYLATFKMFESIKHSKFKGDKGTCVLVFERKPQKYLKSGEKTVTLNAAGSIKNPTRFKALPLITVYGSGTLTVNNVSITIATEYAHLDIDCDLQEVLQTDGNLDVTLTNGEFPYLDAGINNISFTGLSKVEIKPRWCMI